MEQSRSENTRQRLMEAALVSIAEQGYAASGVAEICERAGVSKGAFYHHFASKQALFVELLDRWLAGLDAALSRVRDDGLDAPAQLLRMAEAAEPVFASAAGQLPIILEFWAQASRDPEIRAAAIAPYRRFQAVFSGIIARGIAEGTLAARDPDGAAQALVSLAVGVVLQGLLDPNGTDWGHVLRQAVEVFLKGLEVRS